MSKVKKSRPLNKTLSQGMSLAILDHTLLPATRTSEHTLP